MNTKVYQLIELDNMNTLCVSADYAEIQTAISYAIGRGGWTLPELRVDTWQAGERTEERSLG